MHSHSIKGTSYPPPTTLQTDLPDATNVTAHDEPKANRQHEILDLLGHEPALEARHPASSVANVHVQVPAWEHDTLRARGATAYPWSLPTSGNGQSHVE